MGIISTVEQQFTTLSRQERKVALKVIQDPEKVQNMSISNLAKTVGVSNATITRFVKKMGCHDFYTFKLQLAGNHDTTDVEVQQDSIPDQTYNYYRKILKGTWERLDITKLQQTVTDITQAKRIYLFGLGSSGYTAHEMTQRLLRMGLAAFCMTDSHIMYISSSIVGPDDLIIAVSLSGNTVDVNRSVALAQEKGAKAIAITASETSPLAKASDLTILVKDSNFVNNSRFVNSQFAIIYVLDIITTMLLDHESFRNRMNQTVALIMDQKLDPKK